MRVIWTATKIYTMNLEGSELMKLTNNKVTDCQAVWSPDGKGTAFKSYIDDPRGENYVMNVNGFPSWSPDGKKISLPQ
ncbi:MAG: TolB family protein [Candidatus Bathyarchaeia archaeon]